jgi:hypothetical protein
MSDKRKTEDRVVDMQDLFARFTLDCFFEIAFHQKLNCLENETPFHRYFVVFFDDKLLLFSFLFLNLPSALDSVIHLTEVRTLNPFFPW